MNTDVKEKQLVERDDLDLLELVCQLHSRALRANTEEMHFTYLAARRELEKRLHVYAKAYAPVPELSYSDKLFERYVVDARNEFVKFIVKHDSHIEAEHGRITEEGIKLRTACEDILIAYDQIKEKLAAPVPGKEETFLGVLEENYKAAKLLTDEDKIRPAQEVLLETYEDLISIYKHKYSKNGK